MCMYVCMHACIVVCVCVCVYIYIYICQPQGGAATLHLKSLVLQKAVGMGAEAGLLKPLPQSSGRLEGLNRV